MFGWARTPASSGVTSQFDRSPLLFSTAQLLPRAADLANEAGASACQYACGPQASMADPEQIGKYLRVQGGSAFVGPASWGILCAGPSACALPPEP